jgi:hypothetical protein
MMIDSEETFESLRAALENTPKLGGLLQKLVS